ncbi:MAG: hypothetical protein IJW76_01130 [Clostridia bacterium]|nr:hypothetical protein [Clostridia bacterium]
MKKNKMMRVASALLVAVLMTTSVISGTFAKYVTTDSASDEARVAKWGVVVDASGSLYGEKYSNVDNKITSSTDENIISVYGQQDLNLNKVVAPGTESDLGFSFSINGKPEVDNTVQVQMTIENIFLAAGEYGVMVQAVGVTAENYEASTYYYKESDKYVLDTAATLTDARVYYELKDAVNVGTAYYPVVYKLTGISGATTDDDGTIATDSLKEIADTIFGKVNISGATVTKNADPDGVIASKYTYDVTVPVEQNLELADVLKLGGETISWEWAIDNTGTATYANGADTILGNLYAGKNVVVLNGSNYELPTLGTHYNLKTSFSITITVTQVD